MPINRQTAFTLVAMLICVLIGCTQTKGVVTPETTAISELVIPSPTVEHIIPSEMDNELPLLDQEGSEPEIGKCDLPWLPSMGDWSFDWSRDRHLLAFSTGEALYAINTTNLSTSPAENKAFRLSQQTFDFINDIAWSSDGQKLAFIGASRKGGLSELFVLDMMTTEIKSISSFISGENLTWSPNDEQILYTSSNYELSPNLHIIEVSTGQHSAVTTLPRSDYYVSDPFWSFDGQLFAFGIYPSEGANEDSTIHVFDMIKEGVNQLSAEGSCDYHPVFSPFENLFIFLSKKNDQWDLYRMNANGKDAQQLTNSLLFEAQPSWSPDGTKIAYVSHDLTIRMDEPAWVWNDLLILDIVTGQSLKLVQGSDEVCCLQYPMWSSDGQYLIYLYSTSSQPVLEKTWSVGIISQGGEIQATFPVIVP